MSDEAIPARWQPVLEQRFESGTSLREMARQIGMPHPTFIRVIKGKTSHKAISQVAAYLRISTDDVYELRGENPTTPYTPPERSRHLSTTQRLAVDAVINAMLERVADDLAGDRPDNVMAFPTPNPAPPLDSETLAADRGPKGPDEDQQNE